MSIVSYSTLEKVAKNKKLQAKQEVLKQLLSAAATCKLTKSSEQHSMHSLG